MSLELDQETFDSLWYVSPWEAITELAHEQREKNLARQREHNAAKSKAQRPEKCPGCGKPLVQNLGTRVRHYCNRKCQRAAKRSGKTCAGCGKAINHQGKWCTVRCRESSPEYKAKANKARALRRKIHGRKEKRSRGLT